MSQATLETSIGDRILAVQRGDITNVAADAIGNAADPCLSGGVGLDKAIHRAGGPSIKRELRLEYRCCPTGQAVASTAGRLPAKWVLHAVGPKYKGGRRGEGEKLVSCYRNCIALASELGAESLTLPGISTGVYGYPLQEAADIAVTTVAEALSAADTTVRRVTFVLFPDSVYTAFARSLRTIEKCVGDRTLAVLRGDITKVAADAIGNAADPCLSGGGGLDKAIHRAGGPSIKKELRLKYRCCPTGQAVASTAGRLPAKWVLHAVGPKYKGGRHGEAEKLASCYRNCIALASELGAESLTLPGISTGVYGYPLQEAADIAVTTVAEALSAADTTVRRVTFVLFPDSVYAAFARSLRATDQRLA